MTKYFVCTSGSLVHGSEILLPGQSFDPKELGLSDASCSQLEASGRISKESVKRGKFPAHGSVTIKPEQTVDAPGHDDKEPEGEKARDPLRWQFTDEQLRGKNLGELNSLIVERGGAKQDSVDNAMVLLQSELE